MRAPERRAMVERPARALALHVELRDRKGIAQIQRGGTCQNRKSRATFLRTCSKDLPVRRQCTLLNLARSGVYRAKPAAGADDLALMRRIDELHLELPLYGSRRMMFELNKEGRGVNRKRVRRLMRLMGEAGQKLQQA